MELANTNNAMMEIKPTNDIFYDMQMIIETAQRQAYNAVDVLLVQRNWLIGSRIAAEAIGAEDRAKYGAEIIKTLSDDAIIYDIVYNPIKTELIRRAIKYNKKYVSGLDMLVYQGAAAFEIWTGQYPNTDKMKIAALEELV